MRTHFYKTMKSPVGDLTLVANDKHLVAVGWENDRPHPAERLAMEMAKTHPILAMAETQLGEYFGGHRKTFQLPMVFHGTDFQIKVWNALRTIPYGATRSYGDLASQIGSPQACRAVGAASGLNPLPIVVPCHRVIGSDGKLTGFGGGMKAKAFLLNLECAHPSPDGRQPAIEASRPTLKRSWNELD